MKKLLSITLALGLCAAALTGAPKTAQAHTDFFVSLGFAPPPPVVYAPPPRVIYAPQPVRYYYPSYYYPTYPVDYGWRNYHHDWDRDHDRDRRYDRDRDHDYDRDHHHDWR